MTEGQRASWTEHDLDAVIKGDIFLLPSVQQGSGPFPHHKATWLGGGEPTPARRHVAVSFYLALTTAPAERPSSAAGPAGWASCLERPECRPGRLQRLICYPALVVGASPAAGTTACSG